MDAAAPRSASVVEPEELIPPSPDSPPIGDQPPEGRMEDGADGRRSASSPPTAASPSDDPEGPSFGHTTVVLITIGMVVALAASLVMRFWTKSDLWLDEALTVNIARLPLREIPSFLRRDGAPPLYYVLLHFWMGWFGTSDEAVRALSGAIGVITLPFAYLAGKRLGGRTAGWAAFLLVATSPFAIRYDTEARMYSLVVLLTVLGFLALDRSVRHPRPGNLIAVAAVTGLLLYTHYWSLYLIGSMLLWLAWVAWRGRPTWRRGARASLAAGAVGCLTFLPWLPIFMFQTQHTGTPWATPANFAAMVSAVASFAGGSTSQGRALALIFFGLAGLGLFGVATDRHHIDLDIRTRPLGRPVAIAVGGTLAAAVAGGFITNSAFDARYASVVFIPLILLVVIGLTTFRDRRVRTVILALAVIAGLAGSIPDVTTNRTQAGQVARAIAAHGRVGDVVAYCPDQLGPAVNRLLPTGRYRQTTFPRGTGPVFVNWVDYAAAARDASPVAFAQHLESLAGATGGQIFLVWAGGYQGFGLQCEGIVQTLQEDPAYHAQALVVGDDNQFYQPMWMVGFTPTKP
jgi:mannosyltransferase